MTNGEVTIRVATVDDAEQLHAIYLPYVEKTVVTFECVPPTVEQFAERISTTLLDYPYLVAEYNGKLLGYSYARRFRQRRAYDWAVETSIYVDQFTKGKGVGGKLYRALEAALQEQGVLNMYACVAFPREADEYSNTNSACFHEHLGFRRVGEFENCGHKMGRWYNMLMMEKIICEHPDQPAPLKRFDEVREIVREKYGIA